VAQVTGLFLSKGAMQAMNLKPSLRKQVEFLSTELFE
jgi:hypothetical protein